MWRLSATIRARRLLSSGLNRMKSPRMMMPGTIWPGWGRFRGNVMTLLGTERESERRITTLPARLALAGAHNRTRRTSLLTGTTTALRGSAGEAETA